jgi:hypothetical protein
LEDWLSHPVLSAAFVPGIVGLMFAAVLARTRLLGVAQAAGFIACASLVVGWSTEPLTATRKLAYVGAATALLCLVYEFIAARRRAPAVELAVILAAASVWVLWRLLAQKETAPAFVGGLLAAGYVAAQVLATIAAGQDPVRGAAAGTVLGWTTGVVCIFGASAVLGILSLAAGTAAAATLFVQAARNRKARPGPSISVPAATVAALAGIMAVASAELSPYALIPLLAVAPITRFIPTRRSERVRAVVALVVGTEPALVALGIAWFRWA